MSGKSNKILAACCVVAALAASPALWADPPGRVGRLNFVQGTVSFKPGNMEEWTTATLNYPLTAGDNLWTDASSRAEVHVGSTAIRLGAGSEFSFLELDDQKVQISLPQGLLNVRLRELDSDESFEIDTPTMSVSLLAPGSYRVEVGDAGDTRATVNEGQLEAVVDGLAYPLRANQTAFVAQADWLSIEIGKAPAADEWDQWCAQRDRREDSLASVQYVPRTMIGCEDLDWYGSWSVTVEFGPVWTPRSVPAGWAPYRHGHWAWVEPWGWTWIDRMPWGFAPFHYGRWAIIRGVWVWVPGVIVRRPVYAPALVVFIEAGSGGVTADWRIGWFPLGPREVYVPAYRVSHGYIQKVNVTHVRIGDREVIDATRIRYAHREVARAYTVVPRQAFSQARPVGDVHREISGEELSRARVRGTAAPVVPQRESVLGAPRAQRAQEVSRPPEGAQRRRVYVRNAPSTIRTPFEEQQRERAENPGQPPEQQTQRERASTPWIKQRSRAEPAPQGAPRQDEEQGAPQVRQAPQGPEAREPQVRQAPQGPKANERQTPRKKQKVWKKKILPNGEEVWVEE